MECKNCNAKLIISSNFCFDCGAKIITNRLTFSMVLQEFLSNFISWDNKFFKTLIHLFTQPEVVINGYIDGVRKRYMQPFGFLIVSLTLYGVYMFFAKDSITEYMEQTIQSKEIKNEEVALGLEKYYNFLVHYFNLFTFILIPITSLLTLFVFRKFKHNFIEHNIILIYVNSQFNIISVILGFVVLIFSLDYAISVYPLYFILIFYYAYIFKRVFTLSLKQTIFKTMAFWFWILFSFIFIGIVAGIFIALTK